MGRIRAKTTGSMSLIAKISLMLAITMVFSLSLCIDGIGIQSAAADTLIHNSDALGTCSNATYTNKADCVANLATWTPGRWSSLGGWGVPSGKYGEFVCETCHTKNAPNIKRIKGSITTPDTAKGTLPGDGQPIIFNKTKGTVGDAGTMGDDSNTSPSGRTSSDKICEVCHTYDPAQVNGVNVHAYNSGGADLGNHQDANAKDCIVCHKHNAGFKPLDCNACHGMPPTVNTAGGPDGLALYEGKTTGSTTAGKHATHATTLGYDCNTCHSNSVMPQDSTVNLGFLDISIGFSTFGVTTGTYSGQTGLSYNQTLGTGGLTCSTVYCHSSGQAAGGGAGAPTYATPTWTGSVVCGDCHNSDGVQGTASMMATGTHGEHVNAPYSKACSTCHSGGGSGTAEHVNRIINMGFGTDVFGTTGSFSQTPNVPGNGYGSCSNVYCHSRGQKENGAALQPNTADYKTVAWGGAVVCGNCHTVPPFTGKHLTHVSSYGFTCYACHNNAGINETTGVPTSKHADMNIDMSFDPTYGASASYSQSPNPPGNGYGTCSTLYCHSNAKGVDAGSGFASYATPSWSGTLTCKSCHGVEAGSLFGEPAYANGGAGHVDANTHARHVSAISDCNLCHTLTADAAGDVQIGDGKHVNKTKDVDFAVSVGGSYTAGTKTCSTTSCHSSGQGPTGTSTGITYGTPTWGGAALSCGSCHKDMDTDNTAPGSHVTHAQTKGITCASCHNGYTETTVNATTHNKGTINLSFSGALATGTTYSEGNEHALGSGYGTCSTTYCHSSGQSADGTSATPVYAATAPTWGGTAACGSCHATTTMATGSHSKHLAADTNCGLCHTDATLAAYNDAKHVNKLIDVAAGHTYSAGGAPGNGYGTCSTASCHANVYGAGTVVTPTWGSTGNACNACHTTPIAATGPATGSHALHAETDCTLCHNAGTTATTKPSTEHADGDIDTALVGYTDNKAKGSAYTTCSTASCHANVYGAGTVVTPTWGSTGNACNACHTTPIAATGPATGSHALHAETDCTLCHNAGTTATTKPSTEHTDGDIDTALVGYTDNKAKGSAYTTCSTASCHANVYGAGTVVTPTWGSTGNACNACHTTPIAATGPATGSHALHAETDCTLCHNAGTTATTKPSTEHADGDIDTALVGYTDNKAKGSAYTTCSTASCHANVYGAGTVVTPTWGSIGAACNACHSIAIGVDGPATGSHTAHAGKACTECHNAGTTATTKPSIAHADGDIDIVNTGYPADVAKHAAGSGYSTCTTVYCHSDGAGNFATVTWGATSTGCNFCHSDMPTTGSHTLHIAGGANYSFGCAECHGHTGSGPTHGDGSVTVVASVGYNGSNQCTTSDCHSDGQATLTYAASPAWGGSFTGDRCASCHGNSPSSAAHQAHVVGIHYDNIYNNTSGKIATAAAAGTNAGHGNPLYSTTISCNVCHNDTVTVNYNDKGSVCSTASCHGTGGTAMGSLTTANLDRTKHVNRVRDVKFANITIASKSQLRDDITTVTELDNNWDRNNGYKVGASSHDSSAASLNTAAYVGGSCSSVACHNGNAVAWTAGAISCDKCHTALPK